MSAYNHLTTSRDLSDWVVHNTPCRLPNDSISWNTSYGDNLQSTVADDGSRLIVVSKDNQFNQEDDAAYSINQFVDTANYRINSFAVSSYCYSVNEQCNFDPYLGVFSDCPIIPDDFPLQSNWFPAPTGPGYSPIISSPNSSTNYSTQLSKFSDLLSYPVNTTDTGPYGLWLQFWWPVDESFWEVANTDVLTMVADGTFATAFIACSISFFNVTADITDDFYTTIVVSSYTDRYISDGFSGPLRAGLYNDRLLEVFRTNLTSPTMTDDDRMDLIMDELNKVAINSTALFANQTGPTIEQSLNIEQRILARYVIHPVLLLIAFLFLYTGFALLIFILTSHSFRSQPTRIQYGRRHPVSVLDMTRTRLVSPVAQIAEIFADKDDSGTNIGSLAMGSAMEMFNDKAETRRVKIGVHFRDSEKAEVFGLFSL